MRSMLPEFRSVTHYRYLFSLVLILASSFARGQSLLKLRDGAERYPLEHYIEVLEDPQQQFTIAQVSSPAFATRFRPDTKSNQNYGYTTSGYWLRLRIHSTETRQRSWLIRVFNSSLEEAVCYIPDSSAAVPPTSRYLIKQAGTLSDFRQREVKFRYPVFPVTIHPGEVKTLYFYFASRAPLHFPMEMVTLQHFAAQDHLEQLLQGLYYGILMAMIFYNLFLYISIHDRNYLYYLLYVISFGLLQASITGMANEYLWSTPSWLADHSIPVFAAITAILGSLFCSHYLNLPKNAPFLYKAFLGLISGAVLLLLSNLLSNTFVSIVFSTIIGMAFALLVFIAALYCLWTNFRPALYLLIAWSVLLVGIMLFTLNSFGVLPSNFLTTNSIQIGSAMDVILLSLALANRINLIRDEKLRMEQEKIQAVESKKMKEDFLAAVSHEIRTPMNAIVGFARLLEQSPLDKKQIDYARHIRLSADNLLIIINDILDIAKIGAGKINFERVEVRLAEIFRLLSETVSFQVKEKELKVGYQIDPQIPAVFLGDPVRLHQVLLNLLSNAVKFTQQGEVRLKAELYAEDENQLTISFCVEDTGIGIPPDKLPIIFDSFTQASTQTTRMYGGTGLGLTIVKQLVELQGGQVFVESQENSGSVFTVILPFYKASSLSNPSNSTPEATPINFPEQLRILVMDDNPVNLLVAVHTLHHWKRSLLVDTVTGGKEGIQRLRSHSYDLLLVDLQMPDMDGLETTRYIRNFLPAPQRDVPIFGLSASVAEQDKKAALDAGMNDYLAKPFEVEELMQKFKNLGVTRKIASGNVNKFDISHVQKAGLGDREFMIQLMDMFLEKTPDFIAQMREAAEKHQWKEVSEIAHKIKSIFICMGLHQLQEALLHIEQTALSDVSESRETLSATIDAFQAGCEVAYLEITTEKENLAEQIEFGK